MISTKLVESAQRAINNTAALFGYTVRVSGTPGNAVAIVGAYNETVNGIVGAGAAYVYADTGSGWILARQLTAENNSKENGYFGLSVSISGTPGNAVAIVGCGGNIFEYTDEESEVFIASLINEDDLYNYFKVYIFDNVVASVWTMQSILSQQIGDTSLFGHLGFFGLSVDISGIPGDAVAIVNHLNLTSEEIPGVSIYINSTASIWDYQTTFVEPEENETLFGISIGISGTPGNAVAIIGDVTKAFVYSNTLGNTWTEPNILTVGGETQLGKSVSISGYPGNAVAIVGSQEDTAHIFTNLTNDNIWTSETILTANESVFGLYSGFGYSVDISGTPDDYMAIVGAPNEDVNTYTAAGAAYIFSTNTEFSPERITARDNSVSFGFFGTSVSIYKTPTPSTTKIAIVGMYTAEMVFFIGPDYFLPIVGPPPIPPCFAGNTPIQMAYTGRTICVARLKIGDSILKYNGKVGVVRHVVHTQSQTITTIAANRIESGIPKQPVQLTPNHLVQLPNGRYVRAGSLGWTRRQPTVVYHILLDDWTMINVHNMRAETCAWKPEHHAKRPYLPKS